MRGGCRREDDMSEWEAFEPPLRPVPQRRIREKVDTCMARRDYPGVERCLRYWLGEARLGRDLRGELMVLNELVGHYRKMGDRENALECADAALNVLEKLGFGGTLSEGTTCVNIATALNAFSENERAMALFERARTVYESAEPTPELLGGLYNNMALTCAALGRYDEAETLYHRAMDAMRNAVNGELEQAITCLNLADLVCAEVGMEAGEARICGWLDRAVDLLNHSDAPRDGYYAFVCEKCAPTLDYYGYFADAEALRREAARIYEGA